eukprot:GHVO01034071.1.p1 GENE.GHVO01034071.1~~GHVO01034071.1.p1  ORF type:complete len:131 (-),score=20.42 GHVO01034071.1:68-430(-)
MRKEADRFYETVTPRTDPPTSMGLDLRNAESTDPRPSTSFESHTHRPIVSSTPAYGDTVTAPPALPEVPDAVIDQMRANPELLEKLMQVDAERENWGRAEKDQVLAIQHAVRRRGGVQYR